MISLNFRDSRPIYEQLRENLRQMILSGAIGAEEKLPSVRELEAAGYIYTIPGKGSFAAPLNEVHDETRNKLLAQFSETARALLQLGLQQEELSGIIQKEAKQID